MSDLAKLARDLQLDNLHRVVQNDPHKFLCFTRIKDGNALLVEVSDGLEVWLLELDKEDLETQKDLNNLSGSEAYLKKIRNGFTTGDLSVARVGTKVTLTIGKGSSTVSMDLFEARAAEKKTEFQNILFRLAGQCSQLEADLTSANQQIDSLKAQKSAPSGGLGALMDLSPKKGPGKAKPSKVGMSVVNPSSRKRKAATGVVFDSSTKRHLCDLELKSSTPVDEVLLPTTECQQSSSTLESAQVESSVLPIQESSLEFQLHCNESNVLDVSSDSVTSSSVDHQLTSRCPEPKRKESSSQQRQKDKHPMLSPCSCKHVCIEKIPQRQREQIHFEFWDQSYNNRKKWMSTHCSPLPKKLNCERGRLEYFLLDSFGVEQTVCSKFFLRTLGFGSNHVINSLKKSSIVGTLYVESDKRGKATPSHALSVETINAIDAHIDALNVIPQYLGSDITVRQMHKQFLDEHPEMSISYNSYRRRVTLARDSVLSFTCGEDNL